MMSVNRETFKLESLRNADLNNYLIQEQTALMKMRNQTITEELSQGESGDLEASFDSWEGKTSLGGDRLTGSQTKEVISLC